MWRKLETIHKGRWWFFWNCVVRGKTLQCWTTGGSVTASGLTEGVDTMSRKISNESACYLTDELLSIIKMLKLGLLAVDNEEDELAPTAIETAYHQLQDLVDEFCVVRELTEE